MKPDQTIFSTFTEEDQVINYSITYIALSDYRLKKNIEKIGQHNAINVYRFQYMNDPAESVFIGVMAQEVIESHPDAVIKNANGFYRVNYYALGLKMVTYEEYLNDPLAIVRK